MKFASSVIALALASGVVVNGMSIRGNTRHANKLIASARRLEEGSGDSGDGEESGDSGDEEESEDSGDSGDAVEEMSLTDYSITLLTCISGEQVTNDEDGESESSSVVFRLCPSSSCNMTTTLLGCDDGYGDYVVGIDTFLQVYMESQGEEESQDEEENDEDNEEENYQQYDNPMIKYNKWGQAFDASQYMECAAFEQQQGGNNYYRDMQFYIGPGCSADGSSIALHTYMDDACTTSFDGNFTLISAGWESLPFSDGGIVSMECVSCATVDEDYNVEVNEMCEQEYGSSVAQCDNTTSDGCDYVDYLLYQAYGNLTDSGSVDRLAGVKDAVSQVSTKFMDTMSTKEARAFIAAMVIFALSFAAGLTFISCLCVKKRREGKTLKKASQALLSGSDDEDETPKRRSSVVSLVRASTNQLKEQVSAAFEKKEEDEKSVQSQYEVPELNVRVTVEEPTTPKRSSTKFFAKMDKHLKKKLSPLSPKNISLKFPLSPKKNKN